MSDYTVVVAGDSYEITESPESVFTVVTVNGTTGAEGPQGPQGPSVFTHEGVWSFGVTYQANDVVVHNGSGYYCLQATSLDNPPDVNPSIWGLIAEKGDQGIQGVAGNDGADGADGADGQGVPTGGTAGQLLSKIDGTDFNTEWTDPPVTTGTANRFVAFNEAGELQALDGYNITQTNGISDYLIAKPNGTSGGYDLHRFNADVDPLQNSPDESWHFNQNQVNMDPNDSGFQMGTTGTAFRFCINNVNHFGTGDMGGIEFIQNNFTLGNGTDPIDIKGFGYMFGFGQVAANANVSGPMQGYGYQPNISASASISSTAFTQAFYDAANIGCESPNYNSFNATPMIASIANNNNFNGVNINPNITSYSGNAGANAIAIGGNWGAFDTGGFNGVNINPTMTGAHYANGIAVYMDNVSMYAGTVSSLVIQDLTISFQTAGDNNNIQVAYVDDVSAGSETAALGGNLITVHIESGVSTATQVKAAIEANPTLNSNLTVTISGVASDPQVTQAATNLTGGNWPGTKKAGYFDGDVEITGALTFGGALSVGKLNAFYSQALTDGGGTPSSIHSLITQPTVAANATLTTADSISVNTAALINIGDNASVSTAFIGIAALGLPAVLTMGTGSTVDRIYGALFALSLDAGGTGGTADEVGLCKALAIPNGVTAVNNLYGYLFDLPFGDPGTKTFGFYDRPGKNNYFAGQLLIGGTPGSDDTVTNASVALEIKSTTKAFMNARMTTTERDALTAVNGMQLYNSTTDKLQVYAGGSWVDLH